MKPCAVPLVLAALLLALPAAAQDVEMLGRVYGTRPPPSYVELLERDPDAFRFQRAWSARTGLGRRFQPAPEGPGDAASLRLRGDAAGGRPGGATSGGAGGASSSDGRASGGMPSLGADSGPAKALGRRAGPVAGTFLVPLVLGLYADSPDAPFTRQRMAQQFFEGPNPTGTITDYYREASGGRVELLGQTFDWVRTSLTAEQVAGGVGGLGSSSRVGEFIVQVLGALEGSVDWGRFDSDGPDGLPNSGDDDGFVDVLSVMHPTRGAECDEDYDLVWSHRWSLEGAMGEAYRTTSRSARGGVIRVDDYTIQPARACSTGAINQIGVFAHELGHAFGLPDLYGTGDVRHAGIGRWGLMGTGSWGCGATHEPERPCGMGAWGKAILGWVSVETLPAGADLGTLTLDPVETSERVLRVDAGDGTGEYFLLENRQRIGFDGALVATGLLVWQVDTERVRQRWTLNAVNAEGSHPGVWLRQADGENALVSADGNRGDAGDPFPGASGATAFHAGSTPGSLSHRGTATGLTLLDITSSGQRMRFRLLTRYQTLHLRGAGELASFVVDGDTLPPGEASVRTAPFQDREVSAPAGAQVREGVRRAFTAWSDAAAAGRTRAWVQGLEDATLTAAYEGAEEVHLSVVMEGDTAGVSPGSVEATPASVDGWYATGVEVSLLAQPRTGFDFLGWQGDLAGRPNPVRVSLAGPVAATAVFQQAFGVAATATLSFSAAVASEIVLQASQGSLPYAWSLVGGRLPAGMAISSDGRIGGAALEAGTFPLTVQAVDGIGLVARAALTLEVDAPVLGIAALTDPFFLRPDALTVSERAYLDRAGNTNGAYDLGDFRSYVLANPELPMTAAERDRVRALVPLIDFGPGGDR